jgi:hypothetical protein
MGCGGSKEDIKEGTQPTAKDTLPTRLPAGAKAATAAEEVPPFVGKGGIQVDDAPTPSSAADADADADAEEAAATAIQAGFRGHQARQEVAARRVSIQEAKEDKAATVIQASYRGHKTRAELKDGQTEAAENEDPEPEEEVGKIEGTDEEHAAAAKIQAGFRGLQVRKGMKAGDAAAVSATAPPAASGLGDAAPTKVRSTPSASIEDAPTAPTAGTSKQDTSAGTEEFVKLAVLLPPAEAADADPTPTTDDAPGTTPTTSNGPLRQASTDERSVLVSKLQVLFAGADKGGNCESEIADAKLSSHELKFHLDRKEFLQLLREAGQADAWCSPFSLATRCSERLGKRMYVALFCWYQGFYSMMLLGLKPSMCVTSSVW